MMIITRSDGVSFIANSFYETIPLKVSKRVQLDTLESLRKVHEGEFVYVQRTDTSFLVSFAKTKCFSLGGAALSFFSDMESFIWVDRINDKNDYIFVCVDNSKIIAETIVSNNDIAPYILANALLSEPRKKIFTSTELPEFIVRYFKDRAEKVLVDDLTVFKEIPILESLPFTHAISYRPYETVYAALENSTQSTLNKIILFGLVVIGLVWYFVSDKHEKESLTEVPFVDPYQEYKPLINGADVATALNQIYKVLIRLEPSYLWRFNSCSYSAGMPMICELENSISSRTSDLNRLTNLVGEGAQVNLKNSNAVIVIPIQATNSNRSYSIINHRVLIETIYDRLLASGNTSQLNLLTASHNSHWTTQVVKFGSSKAGLYNLALVANAINGLPVNIESVIIKREDDLYSIDYSIISFGGK